MLVALFAFAAAGSWAVDVDRVRAELKRNPDAELARQLKTYLSDRSSAAGKAAARRIEGQLELIAETRAQKGTADSPNRAKAIQAELGYRDPGVTQSSNWLQNALRRLSRFLEDLLSGPDRGTMQGPTLGPWVEYVAWGVLGALLLAFAYLVIRHLRWKAALRRETLAVLDDDEPERSVDEWLELARSRGEAGDFRGAVRCLYLACLLKFDEAGVARFDRGQTNWEHLARIEVSPRRPANLDFRAVTREFDRIWYGRIVRGKQDYELFLQAYEDVKRSVRAEAAA
jgi:hypothetical protein